MTELDLIIATHNAGKVSELGVLVSPLGLRLQSAADFGLPVPDETGATFEENASLKAVAAAKGASKPALADDSGVCVDALGGEPGIHTADWAGEPRDFAVARNRVREALAAHGTEVERARTTWVTTLALAWPDGRTVTVRGEARGVLVWPERVADGFGFEPIFLPDGFAITYSEMDAALKRRINARASAFRQMWPALRQLASR